MLEAIFFVSEKLLIKSVFHRFLLMFGQIMLKKHAFYRLEMYLIVVLKNIFYVCYVLKI